jgi:hypothetical protein
MTAGAEKTRTHSSPKTEWLGLFVLVAMALILRWWHLDLMPFRYDAAEALIRARETLALGYPPLTGIVNSLGFRNPPGLEWLILPAVLISPDPRAAAAWIAVLIVSGTVALWWAGRSVGGRPLAWSAALLYAFLPQTIFSSRDVWAQHLLIPLGAWSLAFVLHAVQAQPSTPDKLAQAGDATSRNGGASSDASRQLSQLLAATAFAGVAALVHLAASLWFAGLLGAVLVLLRNVPFSARPRWRMRLGVLFTVFLCALLPSLLDWHHVVTNPPKEKPPHVRKFEQTAPPPKPLLGRLAEAYGGLFDPLASLQPLTGLEQELPPVLVRATHGADLALLAMCLAGLALTMLVSFSRSKVIGTFVPAPSVARLLFLWVFAPPFLVGALMRYPNATYLYFALGATLLLVCQGTGWVGGGLWLRMRAFSAASRCHDTPARFAPPFVFTALALFHLTFFVVSMETVERVRIVNGPYYVPLREQLGLVRDFDRAGVGRGHLLHLGGPWFQHSFDYLLHEVVRVPLRPGAVVMEDSLLRRHQPIRLEFVQHSLPRQWATIRWGIFPSWDDAVRFADAFYQLPLR